MGVSRAYYTGSPFNSSEVDEINYAQTTDTMYLAHRNHAPGKLLRAGHTDWTYSSLTFGPDIDAPTGTAVAVTNPNQDADNSGANYDPQPAAYVVTAVSDDTGQESRASTSGSGTNDLSLKRNYNEVTWNSVADATRYNVYRADNNQFYGYIGTTEDTTFRDRNITPQLDRAPPRAENPFSGANNRPSVVDLFEQRLIWANTKNAPNGIWGSRTGPSELENMDRSRPARATDSFSAAIVSKQSNPVNQLLSRTSLTALTENGLFLIDGDGSGGALSATSPLSTRPEVGQGSSTLRPILVDNVAFYSPANRRSVRTVGYSFDIDGLKTNDVTIFSPHFFLSNTVVDWAYSREPRSIIWALRDDGVLLAFTWEQEQGVWGWTRMETDGTVLSICTISEGGEDRLYAIIERDVDGTGKRYIERMSSFLWDDIEQTTFLDFFVAGEFSTPQNAFTGLPHLEGRTDVAVVADGAFYRGLSVTNGTLTLPNEQTASKVAIGLPYDVEIETLPFRADLKGMGSNMGRNNQTDDVVLVLQNSGPVKVGPDANHLLQVKQQLSEWGSPFNLLDGPSDEITLEGQSGKEARVFIKQELPAPFTLLNIATGVIVEE